MDVQPGIINPAGEIFRHDEAYAVAGRFQRPPQRNSRAYIPPRAVSND